MKKYKFAIIGATGMVGRTFLKVMSERNLPIEELYLFASKKSAGKSIEFCAKEYKVIELTPENIKGKEIDIALFSAGGSVSAEYAPKFTSLGAVVIDNSSYWRMDNGVPLIVPEVNPLAIKDYKIKHIIANPNCSTIQAMPILRPLNDKYGLKRVVFSTYQAVSGAGMGGISDLNNGINGIPPKKMQHQIAFNCIPHIDIYLENGYFKEEQKMIDETRKILGLNDLRVTATTVRVPVKNGHSESINIELMHDFNDIDEIREVLRTQSGLIVKDDPKNNLYPMPIDADGRDEIFVGRIRRDFSVDSGINLFCCADNIRKGAATNAVQIAELLINYFDMEEEHEHF
ncbi:MAG: aspartate-semialdehyde dehydrogenase [Clostridia bacterium]